MVLRPPVQAEDLPWTLEVDRPGNEPQMKKKKNRIFKRITSNWMQMKMQRHSHQRKRSLLTEECPLAIGNTSSLKRTTSDWETKLPEMDTWGLDEGMDLTTGNEQGVQWDFTNVEMRNKASRKIVAEKPFLLMGAHPFFQVEVESERELESHDTEREMTSCTEPEYICSLFVACTSCSTMKDGTSYMNTAKASCHGEEIASMKLRR